MRIKNTERFQPSGLHILIPDQLFIVLLPPQTQAYIKSTIKLMKLLNFNIPIKEDHWLWTLGVPQTGSELKSSGL